MDTKTTKPTKATKNIPERHKESNDEEMRPATLNLASSLVAEHNELKMKEAELRLMQAEIHFEKQYQEIKKDMDRMIAVMRNQQIAVCLRREDEEQRHILERVIIIALAFLAAIGKLIGLF